MSGEFGRVVAWKCHPSQRRRGSGVSWSNLWSLQNKTNYREGILRAASVWQKTGTLVSHSAKPEKKSSSEVHTNNNTPRARVALVPRKRGVCRFAPRTAPPSRTGRVVHSKRLCLLSARCVSCCHLHRAARFDHSARAAKWISRTVRAGGIISCGTALCSAVNGVSYLRMGMITPPSFVS